MTDSRLIVTMALTISAALAAAPQRPAQPQQPAPPSLAERFPPPPGYSVEQDVESDGARDFSTANGVRGHILRRFVQAGDDGGMSVPEIARYFADRLHAENGFLFDDRLNSGGGRLDGRIPGARPVWLHVDINDGGSGLDIIALEENGAAAQAVPREMPMEETRISGSWTTGELFVDMPAADRAAALRARDALSTLAAPGFRPYQGWAWRVTADELQDSSLSTASTSPYRVHVFGLQRSQACPTCPVMTETHGVTAFTMDVNRVESLGELDPATFKAEGFFIDPGVTQTGQVTRLRDGGRILIARAGRPALYVPVAREIYLRARIRFVETTGTAVSAEMTAAAAEFEKAMKELEKTDPAAARQARAEFAESRKLMAGMTSGGVDELRRELAGLSAEDRRAPATDPVGRHIVSLNPAYFETGRGRAAPHFVVIDIPWKYGVHDVTLYQHDLVEAFLRSAELTDLVK